MYAYVFNFLQKVNQIKDLVLTAGPVALETAADALGRLQEATRLAADYIRQLGGQPIQPQSQQAIAAGLHDSPDAQKALQELTQVHAEVRAALQQEEQQTPGGAQAAFGDRLSPDMKKLILSLLEKLITSVLTKSGQTVEDASPAKRPARTK